MTFQFQGFDSCPWCRASVQYPGAGHLSGGPVHGVQRGQQVGALPKLAGSLGGGDKTGWNDWHVAVL